MAIKNIREYYDLTADRDTREDLIWAIDFLGRNEIAVDCGCGAGSDTAFLRKNDFTVHAFDIEEESILRCKERFKNDDKVILSQDSFNTFNYPSNALVFADASLFFCPEKEFDNVWLKMNESLIPNGIFCGSFLGPKDTMVSPNTNRQNFWPDISVFTEEKIKPKFENFEILRWVEHDISGHNPQGEPHYSHIFSVVARKL